MAQEFELKVQKVIQRSYNVKSVRINQPVEDPAYKAGQLMRLAFKAQAQCAKTLQVILHNEQTKKIKPNEQLVNECVGESTDTNNAMRRLDVTGGGYSGCPCRFCGHGDSDHHE